MAKRLAELRVCLDPVLLLFGWVLAVASVLKAYEVLSAARLGQAIREPRSMGVLAASLAEAGAACWIVSGKYPRYVLRACAVLLVAFVATNIVQVVSGQMSCGCFGPLHVHPLITLGFDLVMLVLVSCRVLLPGSPLAKVAAAEPMSTCHYALTLALALCIGGGVTFAAVHASRILNADTRLMPAGWLGHRFPYADVIDTETYSELASGKVAVVLFDHSCTHCGELLGDSKRTEVLDPNVKVMYLDLNPDQSSIHVANPPGSISLGERPEYLGTIPHVILINNGIIRAVSDLEGSSLAELVRTRLEPVP